MLEIKLLNSAYEYDVRSLSQAFLGNDIQVQFIERYNYSQKIVYADEKYNEPDMYILEAITDVDRIYLRIINVASEIDEDSIIQLEDTLINEKDELVYKATYKNILKKQMYKLLSKALNKTLPWGTLTGIRPTKIVLDKLNESQDDDNIKEYMLDTYLMEESKVDICLEIAHKEKELLDKIDYKNGYSLYIGIPFCPTRCSYCSFTSYPLDKYGSQIDDYLEALYKEIEFASTMIKNKTLNTVYIGGGTPTTLSAQQLKSLIDTVKKWFNFDTVAEFTVEAGRPDSITKDKLEVLKNNGVTRISINPQTMCQKTLDLTGRKHTVESVVEVFNLAREVGHNNINMDLILGLPGEDIDDVKYTLDEIHKLQPDSLTVHTLAIKRAAYLNIYKDRYEELLPKHVTDMVDLTFNYAKNNKLNPYYLYRQKNMTDNLENIGYSLDGKEGIYNILMMEERQTILALGAGAVCKFIDYENNRLERLDNVKSLKDYIERIDDMILKKKNFSLGKGRI